MQCPTPSAPLNEAYGSVVETTRTPNQSNVRMPLSERLGQRIPGPGGPAENSRSASEHRERRYRCPAKRPPAPEGRETVPLCARHGVSGPAGACVLSSGPGALAKPRCRPANYLGPLREPLDRADLGTRLPLSSLGPGAFQSQVHHLAWRIPWPGGPAENSRSASESRERRHRCPAKRPPAPEGRETVPLCARRGVSGPAGACVLSSGDRGRSANYLRPLRERERLLCYVKI